MDREEKRLLRITDIKDALRQVEFIPIGEQDPFHQPKLLPEPDFVDGEFVCAVKIR